MIQTQSLYTHLYKSKLMYMGIIFEISCYEGIIPLNFTIEEKRFRNIYF